ncbi:MAG: hypothetical protein KGM44_13095 [bacterium]|nr:hypothetical protein [bacterium]
MAFYTIRQRDLRAGTDNLLTWLLCDQNRAMMDRLVAVLNAQDGGSTFSYDCVEVESSKGLSAPLRR